MYDNIHSEVDIIRKRLETGKYLYKIRKSNNATLADYASKLGVSANYVSEIERGLKTPSDELIVKIANMVQVSEYDLFKMYGKIPLIIRQQLEKFNSLYNFIIEIGLSENLSDIQRQEIYDSIYNSYKI